jgi:hypothetical protein
MSTSGVRKSHRTRMLLAAFLATAAGLMASAHVTRAQENLAGTLTASTFTRPARAISAKNSRPQTSFGDSPRAEPGGERFTNAAKAHMSARYATVPLNFEINRGQTDSRVKFLSRGSGYTLFLTGTEAVLSLRSQEEPPLHPGGRQLSTGAGYFSGANIDRPRHLAMVRMKVAGGDPAATVTGLDELPGKTNYFIGSDTSRWRTNVPTYAKVKYQGVYPGIDLVYYQNQGQLEYDFVLAPGADPKAIALDLVEEGLAVSSGGRTGSRSRLRLDADGDLLIGTQHGDIRLKKPTVYQPRHENRASLRSEPGLPSSDPVDGRYVLLADNRVGFDIGEFDRNRPLVIDPVLSYSTYLGGTNFDACNSVKVDSAGNVYVTGITISSDFPTASALQGASASDGAQAEGTANTDGRNDWGYADAFVTKLNAAGDSIIFSTYLGGDALDYGISLALDSSRNVYVAGRTTSGDFPTVNPVQPANVSYCGPRSNRYGCSDAFVTKLDATGSAIEYSTYLGGTGYDEADGIAVDSSGHAYVVGMAEQADFPTFSAFQPDYRGSHNSFVTKLSAAGSSLVYSTFLGGTGTDYVWGIAVDSSAAAYLVGATTSQDFPTVNALQAVNAGGQGGCCGGGDAFVAKLNPAGTALAYSTFLGGSDVDEGYSIAVDAAGDAYITGLTKSADFPLQQGLQGTLGGGADAFVTKLNPSGTVLLYSSYLGGADSDEGDALAVDNAGNVYVAGRTLSANFPTRNPLQAYGGGWDAWAAKANLTGGTLLFSTYLGGAKDDYGWGLAADSLGQIYVAGQTTSADFPTVHPIQATSAAQNSSEGFVAKITTANYTAGIQPPINANGSSVFTAKRGVVPVKFSLTLDGVSTCQLPAATIAVFAISGTTMTTINESVYSMAADSGSNFRSDGCQYVFNLGTNSLGTGTYRVSISIVGSVVGTATFGLK